jgi:CheY-like chemotaxis protein
MPKELPLQILLVDDDDVARESVVRNLRKHQIEFPVVFAEDGAIALEILRGKHERKIARPLIILLDLNMPRMNGFEFLQELRSDPALRNAIVFVLTTSSADEDRARAYQENIAGYMVKSAVGPQFAKLAQLLTDYSSAVLMP